MADDKDKAPDNRKKGGKDGDENEKKQGNNKIIFFGIIGAVVVINGLVAFLLIQLLRPPNPEKEAEKMRADSLRQVSTTQTSIGTITEPIEVVVNIAGTGGMRFLKVVVVLEFDEKQYKDLGGELLLRQAKFKSQLIEQLSSMTLDEVEEGDVQARICKEFMRTVNSTLPEKGGEISNVYVNEFIIQ